MRERPKRRGNDDSIQIAVASYKDIYESVDALVESIWSLERVRSWTQVALITCVQYKNTLRL